MTSVPIWQHVIVVLALLIANAATFKICMHRIEELQAALVAKKVLLGETRMLETRVELQAGVACDIGGRTVRPDRRVILTIGLP